MTDFCTDLAGWATATTFRTTARDEARLAVLDTLGCMIAGWDEPQTRAARAAFGRDDSATATALILGTAAHALDFDDYEVPGSTHPSAPILGALLGLMQGAPRPMGDLLDAYVTGYEAIIRLGEVMRYDHYNAGWHATGTIGSVGAAAAAARMLGLDASGMVKCAGTLCQSCRRAEGTIWHGRKSLACRICSPRRGGGRQAGAGGGHWQCIGF